MHLRERESHFDFHLRRRENLSNRNNTIQFECFFHFIMARYDVVLCFRGSDTRRTFTGTLYTALRKARLITFMDTGELKGGDQILYTIIEALEASRVSIVVLSQDFASSRWCLNELVKILECMKTKNQVVIPIFYGVDPSDVRNLRGSFGEAMHKFEYKFGKDYEEIQKWRSALTQVANLKGWCFRNWYL